jgi:hypothetical protein
MTFPLFSGVAMPVALFKFQPVKSAPAVVRTVVRERRPLDESQMNASFAAVPTMTEPSAFTANASPTPVPSDVRLAPFQNTGGLLRGLRDPTMTPPLALAAFAVVFAPPERSKIPEDSVHLKAPEEVVPTMVLPSGEIPAALLYW